MSPPALAAVAQCDDEVAPSCRTRIASSPTWWATRGCPPSSRSWICSKTRCAKQAVLVSSPIRSVAPPEMVRDLQTLSFLRAGDTLVVVWRLDRLGRSLKHLIETVTILHDRGISFISLSEHIDTTTSSGKLIFHIFAALAEFERDVIRERTQAGLQAARARGRHGGRPRLWLAPESSRWSRPCTTTSRTPSRISVRRSIFRAPPCIAISRPTEPPLRPPFRKSLTESCDGRAVKLGVLKLVSSDFCCVGPPISPTPVGASPSNWQAKPT